MELDHSERVRVAGVRKTRVVLEQVRVDGEEELGSSVYIVI